MEHPLPDGTIVIADISCKHCNLGYPEDQESNEQLAQVKIINHVVRNDDIHYRVTGIPISQTILESDVKEIVE